MTELLLSLHTWLGYAVSIVVLVVAFAAFRRAKDGVEFQPALFRTTYLLLSLQVLLGIVLYSIAGYWNAAPLLAYVHPVLAIIGLGVGQALLGRARRTRMAADAYRLAGKALIVTLVFVLAAIGASSAA